MTELDRLDAALSAAAAGGGVPVLVTLARVAGSAYRGPGARMVVLPDGGTVGAISGGCLEKDALAHAEAVRAAGAARTVTFDLTRDDDAPWGLGMGCRAVLDVLFEPCPGGAPAWLSLVRAAHLARQDAVIVCALEPGDGAPPGVRAVLPADAAAAPAGLTAPMLTHARRALAERRTRLEDGLLFEFAAPPPAVVVFGDGADTEPLLRLADALGWCARAVRKDQDAGPLDARSAVVIMTHNYPRDLALLDALLDSPAGYLGVLGPRSRTERLLAELEGRGRTLPPARRRLLRAPAGLDIGAESPEEIALAIAAEIGAMFAGRRGGPLSDRDGPIHDR